MTTLELVNMHTHNGSKNYVFLRFNGWTHSATEIISILKTQGYTVEPDCCTYRHHAIITAEK